MGRPLVFNHFASNTQSFPHLLLLFIIIEFIKVCLRRLREISATRNMKSRLAIKFPTPYEWWSNALPPGQEKASNARGMHGGGGCWSFDLTGTLPLREKSALHKNFCCWSYFRLKDLHEFIFAGGTIGNKFVSKFKMSLCEKILPRDYQGKRVNPPYRSSS